MREDLSQSEFALAWISLEIELNKSSSREQYLSTVFKRINFI